MKRMISFVVASFFVSSTALADPGKARTLVDEMLETVGSYDALKKRGDVEYTYVYESHDGKKRDVSLERYRFDGELSWAKYTERNFRLVPDMEGELIQGWNGKSAWTTVNGKSIGDEKLNGMSRFYRKTNFYWFAMMQKLADPGLTYEYEGQKTLDGKSYEVVKVGFDKDVGDASDTYVLYIDPETKLVDFFLFTVRAFGVTDPLIMTVEYQDFAGLKLPVERKYTKSDWNASVPADAQWIHERMKDLKFSNGFDTSAFDAPAG